MFEDNIFERWLDEKTKEIVLKMGNGQALTSDEMIVLVLKAQTNHFVHLDQDLRQEMINVGNKMSSIDQDLRQEMIALRIDMDKRFEQTTIEMNKRFEQTTIEMNKRFEQVDKRFEQVDKRFEQVDKRFEALTTRIDRFMIWSFATSVTVGGIVIASIKFIH